METQNAFLCLCVSLSVFVSVSQCLCCMFECLSYVYVCVTVPMSECVIKITQYTHTIR